jgi:predicted transcriptional regulator
VIRDLRHVSKETSLAELSRILTRNSFVLVEKESFVTNSDILSMIADPKYGHEKMEKGL